MSFIGRVRAFLSKAETPMGPSASPIIGTLPLYNQFIRIGGNLTPSQVSNIILEADTGQLCRFMDLANESKQKDGHLLSVLQTRENALTALDLEVLPTVEDGESEPSDRALDVAAYVEDSLEACIGNGQEVRSLKDTIPHLVGGTYYGFAVSEIEWVRNGSDITPVGFRPVDHRRFEFSQSDGRLRFYDCYGTLGAAVELQDEYPGKFLQHMPRINGDVAAREGLARTLIWPALFRNWCISDWLKLAELSWKPWRIGKYSKQAGEKDRDELLNALQYLTTNGICLHRDDHSLDIHWPSGTASGGDNNHQSLASFMGSEMSKAVLGQTLTTEQGERGARSLGEVHDRVRRDIRESDAIGVAATLRRDLVSWIVCFKYGADESVPGLAFATDDAVDLQSFSSSLKAMVEAGVDVPQRWAQDKIGIPAPDEDEPMLGDSDAEPEAEDEDDDGTPQDNRDEGDED